MREKQKAESTIAFDYAGKGKKFTAIFLEELLAGAVSGQRNSWITKQFGRMISLGMDMTAAYEWIRLVNLHFLHPPLSDKELNSIIISISKREQQKLDKERRNE
jgi:hypothetical protein